MECIVPECSNVPYSRGLCINCYASARRQVLKGGLTWEELEAKGLSKKPVSRGRRASRFLCAHLGLTYEEQNIVASKPQSLDDNDDNRDNKELPETQASSAGVIPPWNPNFEDEQ